MKEIVRTPKAIHAEESRAAAEVKAQDVIDKLRAMKLSKAARESRDVTYSSAHRIVRAVPGHWGGDLIYGSHNSYIATVVERQSRFTALVKVDGKETGKVVSALSAQMGKLHSLFRQSLTWDRGQEMATHARFSMATKMAVYFCDPQSPWQRETNEKINGLLRQYFPRGCCLSIFTHQELDKIAAKLNNRPRKTLGFQMPADKLDQVLL